MRPELILTGGQTGADQAAWRVARTFQVPTGGWMPLGFQTEDGPRPEFATEFGATEHPSPNNEDRTLANVLDADGTLIFAGDPMSTGTAWTIKCCQTEGKPYLVLPLDRLDTDWPHSHVVFWIASQHLSTLNIAGDRESQSPGIGSIVERYLTEVFRRL